MVAPLPKTYAGFAPQSTRRFPVAEDPHLTLHHCVKYSRSATSKGMDKFNGYAWRPLRIILVLIFWTTLLWGPDADCSQESRSDDCSSPLCNLLKNQSDSSDLGHQTSEGNPCCVTQLPATLCDHAKLSPFNPGEILFSLTVSQVLPIPDSYFFHPPIA